MYNRSHTKQRERNKMDNLIEELKAAIKKSDDLNAKHEAARSSGIVRISCTFEVSNMISDHPSRAFPVRRFRTKKEANSYSAEFLAA